MARISESARIEADNEAVALGFFEEALRGLEDPRRRQGVRYPLRTVVVTALMASVCGCDDAEAMQAWAEANAEWSSAFLMMPHGPPSQDVFLSVFGALDPTQFSRVFERWAQLVSLRMGATSKHIAIDGKTSRRSADPARGKLAVHTVSAWMCGAGLVLGQVRTREKSNEIVAIPELLRVLDLRGATVTIDAMGCQTAIAEAIVDGGGQYLLAVKDNQPALHGEIKETFAEADDDRVRAQDEEPRPVLDTHESVEKAHGRIETRRLRVVSSLAWLLSFARWKAVGYVVEVHRERVIVATGKTSSETVHYVGSGPPLPRSVSPR